MRKRKPQDMTRFELWAMLAGVELAADEIERLLAWNPQASAESALDMVRYRVQIITGNLAPWMEQTKPR